MNRTESRSPDVPLIICFGDSLTAGFQSPTTGRPQLRETPYGDFLQEQLGSRATVTVSGVCGELTGEMVARFPRDVLARNPAYVVVLGGTNDLGGGIAPADIMRNLFAMYEMARAKNVCPVAVTVPSLRPDVDIQSREGRMWLDGHIQQRRELNGMIQRACSELRLSCIDLFTATQEEGSGLLARTYSNDGLHMTTEGYRRIAELLVEQVFDSGGWNAGQGND